jgi:AraC family transcriptional regulator of adaptative response/methylated-DNA-[protein]-cysteine methyltransferase
MNKNTSHIVASACRAIEHAEAPIKLDTLARAAGLSSFHFHRVFKSATGVTPREYAAQCRARRVRESLRKGADVTTAIVDAGYGSGSRFYEKSNALLGMTPSRFRAGGEGAEIKFAVGECTMGAILAAASERGVCAILLGDDPDALTRELQDEFPKARVVPGGPRFERWMAKVVGFVDAPAAILDLPLDIRGTAFQQKVWRALTAVPPGVAVSYADIARRIGAPRAVRAVAGACAANKLALAIPCHRVVRADGALSGYRWGVERKRALLAREAKARATPLSQATPVPSP